MTETRMDSTDRKLLSLLQHQAAQTSQDLGDALHLSPSQAGRRKQRLESNGVILGYHAKLDAAKVGLSIQAFVQVEMSQHATKQAADFRKLISETSAVVSAWTLTGESDYLLQVYCKDLAALNSLIHDVLLSNADVARVKSQIVIDQYKQDAPLPL